MHQCLQSDAYLLALTIHIQKWLKLRSVTLCSSMQVEGLLPKVVCAMLHTFPQWAPLWVHGSEGTTTLFSANKLSQLTQQLRSNTEICDTQYYAVYTRHHMSIWQTRVCHMLMSSCPNYANWHISNVYFVGVIKVTSNMVLNSIFLCQICC